MTGWEIRQALAQILSHDDQVILTGLAWLDPADTKRLAELCGRLR